MFPGESLLPDAVMGLVVKPSEDAVPAGFEICGDWDRLSPILLFSKL